MSFYKGSYNMYIYTYINIMQSVQLPGARLEGSQEWSLYKEKEGDGEEA